MVFPFGWPLLRALVFASFVHAPVALEPAPRGFENAAPRAPSAEEMKERADRMLRAPARARERELGLGPEGPVLTALSEATSLGRTPVRGHAVVRAVADADGAITSLEVVSCDGAPETWRDAMVEARASLTTARVRLPSSAHGARMTIELSSRWALPSGADPDEAELRARGYGSPPALTGFDLSDIRAQPRRVVYAWVVGTSFP